MRWKRFVKKIFPIFEFYKTSLFDKKIFEVKISEPLKALIEQSAEEPCYYAQLPQAKWPPTPQKDQTGSLFAKILDRDECGATPHNSDASVIGETDLPGEFLVNPHAVGISNFKCFNLIIQN